MTPHAETSRLKIHCQAVLITFLEFLEQALTLPPSQSWLTERSKENDIPLKEGINVAAKGWMGLKRKLKAKACAEQHFCKRHCWAFSFYRGCQPRSSITGNPKVLSSQHTLNKVFQITAINMTALYTDKEVQLVREAWANSEEKTLKLWYGDLQRARAEAWLLWLPSRISCAGKERIPKPTSESITSHQPSPVKPNIFLLYWKTAAPELNTVLEGNTAKGRTLCSLPCFENHFWKPRLCICLPEEATGKCWDLLWGESFCSFIYLFLSKLKHVERHYKLN